MLTGFQWQPRGDVRPAGGLTQAVALLCPKRWCELPGVEQALLGLGPEVPGLVPSPSSQHKYAGQPQFRLATLCHRQLGAGCVQGDAGAPLLRRWLSVPIAVASAVSSLSTSFRVLHRPPKWQRDLQVC